MKNKLSSAKNTTIAFTRRHRTAITVAATAAPLIALQVRNAKIMNEFLTEHDLLDKYYETDEI